MSKKLRKLKICHKKRTQKKIIEKKVKYLNLFYFVSDKIRLYDKRIKVNSIIF